MMEGWVEKAGGVKGTKFWFMGKDKRGKKVGKWKYQFSQ